MGRLRPWTAFAACVACTTALTAPTAHADVSIIQSLPLSGAQAAVRRVLSTGTQLYLDWLNLDDGIDGETIRLVARDDERRVEQTVHNVRDMARIDNPVAVFTMVGTANVETLMRSDMLTEVNLPLVSPATGASGTTGDSLVFPIRASHQ